MIKNLGLSKDYESKITPKVQMSSKYQTERNIAMEENSNIKRE